MPYGKQTWLNNGYFSPYYDETHYKLQRAVREFFETVVASEAVIADESNKKISQGVVDKMTWVSQLFTEFLLTCLK